MFKKIKQTLVTFGLALSILSCRHDDIPFHKFDWNEHVDGKANSPVRVRMLNDLLSNHKLKGLSYRQLIEKIGPADGNNQDEERHVRYQLTQEFTSGDIVHMQDLNFYLSADSIVDSWKIVKYDVDL